MKLPVRRRTGILDVGAFQAHRSLGIEVPDTRPLYLAVTAEEKTHILALLLSESRSLEVDRGIVTLRTLNGDIYRLDAAPPAGIDRELRTPIATLTFQERSPGRLTLHGEFLSGDVVEMTIAESTTKNACREAGIYLARFADEVARVRRGDPHRLQLVFTNLIQIGESLALELAGHEGLRHLQQAFRDSWPTWQRPTREAIPTVDVIADGPAAAFPLELLPIFDFGEIPPLENASVIETVASRFLGFTAVVSRKQSKRR